jgi:CRISPR-associated protein Cmr2
MLEDRDWEEQGRKQWEELAAKRTREGHPITADELHSGWEEFLKGNRFLSPALHASLSRALANFALELAPFVVEQRYCGRIVYAGGDDLLALLPLDQVLPAARELRAFYSGQAEENPFGGVDVRLTNTDLAGFVEFGGEKLMTMGTTATASIGVCLAHHLSPLDKALEAARTAEKVAKAKEGYGRDALCVNFLRRSGEEIRVGARWNYVSLPVDTFDLLAGLQRDFAEDQLSMKFAHSVYDQARVLAGSAQKPETEIPDAAREAALRRLLIRQRGAEINSREEAEDQARILAPQLARLAEELQTHCKSDDPSADEPQPGMVQLAQWLQITRFLAQGGDD